MEIFFFIVMIGVGLAVLVVSLLKASSVDEKEPAPPTLFKGPRPMSSEGMIVKLSSLPPLSKADGSTDKPHAPVSQSGAVVDQKAVLARLEEKCAKLESMLEEKNQALMRVETELRAVQAGQQEFVSLREILENQISDLKAQNKRLKDESATALQSSRASAPEAKAEPGSSGIVHAAPDISGVSLRDVFDEEKDKDKA